MLDLKQAPVSRAGSSCKPWEEPWDENKTTRLKKTKHTLNKS